MFTSGGVGGGLTEETICGLMNAAPWPPSAGAFQTSVGAGLPSSSALAKADFLTAALLRSFGWRSRGHARARACGVLDLHDKLLQRSLHLHQHRYARAHGAGTEACALAPGTTRQRCMFVHVPVACRAALNAAEILSFTG